MKKTNTYLKAKFVQVSICFHLPSSGQLSSLQARKREHEKSYLLKKVWLSMSFFYDEFCKQNSKEALIKTCVYLLGSKIQF